MPAPPLLRTRIAPTLTTNLYIRSLGYRVFIQTYVPLYTVYKRDLKKKKKKKDVDSPGLFDARRAAVMLERQSSLSHPPLLKNTG